MDDDAQLFTPREAAKILAISERKLWELMATRQLPAVRLGRAVRYSRGALKVFVAERQK
jgi:excisionase family DNA binding protein